MAIKSFSASENEVEIVYERKNLNKLFCLPFIMYPKHNFHIFLGSIYMGRTSATCRRGEKKSKLKSSHLHKCVS